MAEVNEKYLTSSPVDKIKQDASKQVAFTMVFYQV